MSTKKNNSKSKKKSVSKKSTTNKKSTSKNNVEKFDINSINTEVLAIILISVAFIFFFSIYRNTEFILTSFLKTILIYTFGFSAYIIPILLLIISSYMFVTKEKIEAKKYILFFIIIFSFSAIFDILAVDSIENINIKTSYFNELKYAGEKNGGLIGFIIGNLLNKLVGKFISSTLLIITIIVSLFLLFNMSHSDFSKLINKNMQAFKNFIIDTLKFDTQNEDILEKEIILDNIEDEPNISNLKINDTTFVEKPNKNFKNIKEIRNSDNYGINRKREKKVSQNNNSERNGFFRNKQQKKMNPFAKKTKINIFDFSEAENEIPKKLTRNIPKTNHKNNEDSYFVNIRKDQQTQHANTNVDSYNYSETINTENNLSSIDLDQAQIEQYENTIKSLKDELDRQMFIFQDSQKVFLEQKKVEKSLLTIINAQRETLEKQKNEIEVYKNLYTKAVAEQTTSSQTVIPTPAPTPVPPPFNQTIAPVIEQPKPTTAVESTPFIEDEDLITSTLNSITDDSLKIASESTESNYTSISFDIEDDEDIIGDLDNINDIDESLDKEDDEDNVESLEDEQTIPLHTETPFAQEILNEYNVGIPSSEAIMVDVLANNNLENDDDIENYSDEYINKLINDTTQTISEIEEKTSTPSIYTSESSSIFKSNDTPNYNKPIKPNFDPPTEEKYIYKYPTVDFLNSKPLATREQSSKTELIANSKKLEATLKSFGVSAKVLEVSKGPSVTRYEVQPGLGVKVSKIANLSDDLALNLAAKSIRIQAPIPGKPAVGIEVPNETTETVFLREVLDDENFKNFKSKLAFGIGKDISGKIVVSDLATMPHLLIAGATGAGKSVCVNTLITSIVYKSSPEEVKLLMIDPKVVELSVYNGIPHLLIPVVTDPKKASAALNWAVREMEKRYKLFADKNVRDLKGYNQEMISEGAPLEPQIVIIIDELADLMMTASKEVESAIIRIAQMARAAGIHLIIATQRPTADVITGLIKSNIPSRLAFSVSSGLDSKIILDETGAEKLLGKGDMLFKPMGAPEPYRIQGAFISDKEVESIVSFLKTDTDHEQMKEIIEEITSSSNPKSTSQNPTDTVDEIFEDVVEFIIDQQKASTSLIQRKFRVGFNRAARIVDELEDFGVIGPDEGNKPRKVLMSMQEWDNKFKT